MATVERTKLHRWTFLVLISLAFYLFCLTIAPIWIPVFLGLVISVGVHPLHEKLNQRFKHPRLISGLLTAAVLLAALVLIAFLIFIVGHRALQVASLASERYQKNGTVGLLGKPLTQLLQTAGAGPATLNQRLGEFARDSAGFLGNSATKILASVFSAIFIFIFTALTSYYLLLEGQAGTSWLIETLPLPDGQVWVLVKNVRDVTRAMILGTGVTAAYQGVMAFVGYLVLGVDSPIVWASLTAIASILPGIGTALVWVPISIYVMAEASLAKGIALFLWGNIAIVFVADYIIRPKLVGDKLRMNDLLVFIAIFGGIEAFGILGLLLGPIAVALFLSLLRIYQSDYRPGGKPLAPDPTESNGGKEQPEPEPLLPPAPAPA